MTPLHWLVVFGIYIQQTMLYRPGVGISERSDVAFNTLVISPLCAFLALTFGPPRHDMTEWNAQQIVLSVPIFAVLHDALFWSLHWCMHNLEPFWDIHQQHHSVAALTDGSFAFVAHPLEHALLNCGTFMLPLVLLRVPTEVFFLACFLAVHSTMRAHSDPEGRHSKHHTLRTVNYGNTKLFDLLFDTEYKDA